MRVVLHVHVHARAPAPPRALPGRPARASALHISTAHTTRRHAVRVERHRHVATGAADCQVELQVDNKVRRNAGLALLLFCFVDCLG